MRAYIKYILVAVGLMSFCANAYASDGNELLSDCFAVEEFMDSGDIPEGKEIDIGMCFGIIEGIKSMAMLAEMEGLSTVLNVCFPEASITNGQAVRVVLSYLRKNPKDLHIDRSLLVLRAYRDAYPCSD
ncbi:Rap1a/Tai family immunity protein [Porticoccaceae bacterium]|nr:Rap1a/Tai family immunity protein [Porticoccaceae bacterium]